MSSLSRHRPTSLRFRSWVWGLAILAVGTATAVAAVERNKSKKSQGKTKAAPATLRCPRAMILIPGGELALAGEATGGDPPVRLPPFCIDRGEVTAGASSRWCGRCVPGTAFPGDCGVPEMDMPARCLTAGEAEAHCRARKARLPTDDEWEMAARGPRPQRFPWGDAAAAPGGAVCTGKAVRSDDPSTIGPCPVAGSPGDRSPFGVLDLDGNVPEWTSTPACRDDRPQCAEERIVRGGSWSDDAPAALRDRRLPRPASSVGVGFRCVAEPLAAATGGRASP